MSQEQGVNLIVYFPLFIIIVGMMLSILIDSYISKKNRGILLIIIILILCLIVAEYLEFMFEIDGTRIIGRTLAAIIGYSIRPIILLMYIYIIDVKQSSYWPLWLLVGINFIIHMTALFSGVCFQITAANHFQRGPLGYSCHILSGIFLIYLLYLSIRKNSYSKRIDTLLPIFIVLYIVASVLLDSFIDNSYYPFSFLTIAVAISSLLCYIWLHLQFVQQHELDLQAEQRIQIMMTQIRPHFLYNTIATFKALCRKDPEKASDIADKFGAYLRQNLDSLSTVGRIPFRRELEHTKLYADIEMARFSNVWVEYDIEDDDFTIPPLILQPMVENAIRHGVRIRKEGLVKVITRRQPGYHEITIADNGIGFDVKTMTANGNQHIGVRNVKERIEAMCGGSLRIESKLETGTTVTIRIPIKEEAAT